jgi:septal ring factor EnvC (AmiA/AmiB activator)
MPGRQWALLIVTAILSGGITPFLVALLKRAPEVKQLDAQTTTITIQGAETTVALTLKALERAEAREAALEAKLTAREAKIDELEGRLDHLSGQLYKVTVELDAARRQLAAIRD